MKWKALYLQAEVDDSYTVKLLEQNTAPGMIARIFQEEKQMEDLIDYFKEIWRVGSARESLDFIMGRTQYRSNYKSSEHKDSNAMDVSTAQHGNSRSCFNCRDTGHYVKDCRKLKVECPDCHFLAGGHKKECKCSNMWGVRATNSTQEAAMSWGIAVVQRRSPGTMPIPLQQ